MTLTRGASFSVATSMATIVDNRDYNILEYFCQESISVLAGVKPDNVRAALKPGALAFSQIHGRGNDSLAGLFKRLGAFKVIVPLPIADAFHRLDVPAVFFR